MRADTRLENMEVEVAPTQALLLDGSCAFDPGSVAAAMQAALETLGSLMQREELLATGAARVIFGAPADGRMRFTAAIPIGPVQPRGDADAGVRIGELAGGPALRFVHRGPLATIGETWNRIGEWLRERGHLQSDAGWERYAPMWEEYVSDPATTPPDALVTHIYLSLR